MSTASNVTVIPAKAQTEINRDKYHQLRVAATAIMRFIIGIPPAFWAFSPVNWLGAGKRGNMGKRKRPMFPKEHEAEKSL